MGTWAGRFSWRGDAKGTSGDCLVLTLLISMVLAVLLVISGVEQNPGRVVEVENSLTLMYCVRQESEFRNTM